MNKIQTGSKHDINYKELIKVLGEEWVRQGVSLSDYTTFRLGGPADLFVEVQTTEEFVDALKTAKELNVPVFVIGAGANLLVSDKGFRGLVIKSGMKDIEILGKVPPEVVDVVTVSKQSRRDEESLHRPGLLSLEGLEGINAPSDTLVRVGAGVSLPHFVRWSLEQGLTGMELFSGIPASMGGAIYNNVHGGTRLLCPLLTEVKLITPAFEVKTVPASYLEADYDFSVLQKTAEVVTEATFLLSSLGDVEKAKKVAIEWKERKLKVQPQTNCPGCIFKNISDEDQTRLGWPTKSIGYLFDKLIPWKGVKAVGGAHVSDLHPNFIVNDGTATSMDVINLMREMMNIAKEKYDLTLEPEIILVGFEGDPLV